MGLTSMSTGNSVFDDNSKKNKKSYDYTIALAGNPNVRKIYYFQWFNRNASTHW